MDIDELKRAAKAGDADAQCKLGDAYMFGDGVQHNQTTAIKWYRKAADQEHPLAMAHMGAFYATGVSIGHDYPHLDKWLNTAALAGNADAHRAIGELLCTGRFREMQMPRNLLKGLGYYVQAAKLGDPESQCRVGEMYYHGVGFSLDRAEAAEWFEKAAKNGHSIARILLAEMYLAGDGVPQDGAKAMACYMRTMQDGYGFDQATLDKLAALGIHLETANNNQNGGNDDGRDEIVEPVD